MYAKLRRFWPLVKVVFLLALIFFIGRFCYHDLAQPELWQRSLHPAWLLVAGVCYLLWFVGSSVYWRALLASFKQEPPLGATVRAYYIGQLGKYVPGKAWALLMRANLIHPAGVSRGLATLTSFYEVLTTMASGALVAVVLFAVFGHDTGAALDWPAFVQIVKLDVPEGAVLDRKIIVLVAAMLLCLYVGPILPPLFNRVIHHVSLPFRDKNAPAPRFRTTVLLKGIVLTAVGWLFLGCSLLAVVRAFCGPDLPWSWGLAGRMVGGMALAWVGGFLVLFAPGGLGAREYLIVLFLAPELMALPNTEAGQARALALLIAGALRVVSLAAELLASAALYWLPVKPVPVTGPPIPGDSDNPTGETP